MTDPAAPVVDGLGAAPLLVGAAAADEAGLLLLLLSMLVGTVAPELALGVALGGVNGTVTLRPGSSVVATLAAKFAKVLSPVVGALMAPYMLEESFVRPGLVKKINLESMAYPLLQCGTRPQKNQMGVPGSLIANEYTLTWPEVFTKGRKPELKPF